MKMEQTECSETSAYKIQMPGITQKKAYNIQNTEKVLWNSENEQEFHELRVKLLNSSNRCEDLWLIT
jgi:hypothetical protein